ncbi:orotate phosphoribosyltransferase [Evansella cellulosilytica]|uniref:Orotate phosphoribosyltransferase n=1 Tax=Evansella cellulosilytica (strain ATCC 21833 / DSM 2522 / FERM P-1141 / JCM 9156 / N-4) TaxID=649639 RepID=E6TTQ1_EVAC2|nr:orotate phosphoribosyltransferase [Evansella cellulosilytica]ADU30820.1 orotate phosphoribosyltransferase [Evansella cellulosilytica DSM 2522]
MNGNIAKALLTIGAVSLKPNAPFTWSSGLKSPIYCDNRLTMSYPEVRDSIANQFANEIKERYSEAEVIAGTATAGIPHAAWVADKLGLPMIYIRSKAKGHGKQNMIEGVLESGKKVVVIEDLISTGGSSIQAANAVREAGGDVIGVTSIFTYEFEIAKEAFKDANLRVSSLTTYSALLGEAVQMGKVEESDVPLLEKWSKDPQAWSDMQQ